MSRLKFIVTGDKSLATKLLTEDPHLRMIYSRVDRRYILYNNLYDLTIDDDTFIFSWKERKK